MTDTRSDLEIARAALEGFRSRRVPSRDDAQRIVAMTEGAELPGALRQSERAHLRQIAHLCRTWYLAPLVCPCCEAPTSVVDLVQRDDADGERGLCPSCDRMLELSVGLVGDVWLSPVAAPGTVTIYLGNRRDGAQQRQLAELADEFAQHEIAGYPWPIERRVGAWLATFATCDRHVQRQIEDACSDRMQRAS